MSPKKAFKEQIKHAKRRNINWEFSYSEWLELWLVSGKWLDRGRSRGQYQLCRYGDCGPYSVKNCYIGLVEQNQEDRSKVDIDTVLRIVSAYLNTNKTQYEVAKDFDVDQSYVSRLVSKHRRKYGQNHSASN